MKLGFSFIFAVFLLFGVSVIAFAQTTKCDADCARKLPRTDLDKEDLQIKEENLHLVLVKIASYYQTPIGFEFAKHGREPKQISLDITGKTFEETLKAAVARDSRYEWKYFDGVANVYPKENRDELLKTFLETKVRRFTIGEKSSVYTVKRSLVAAPEIEALFKLNKISPYQHGFFSWDFRTIHSADFPRTRKGFSLDLSNVTMREILNHLIKNSNREYWVINRDIAAHDFWVSF